MTAASPGRRVRVLHVVLHLDTGGLERLVLDLVNRSDRDRFESHVLCLLFPGRLASEIAGEAEVHQAGHLSPLTMLWPGPLIRLMRGIAPDVVHTHSGVWYKASLAARRAGVPMLVHTEHGRQRPDPWKARLLDGLAARRTDVVVAVSDELAEQLSRSVVRDPSRRIVVVRNGVDTTRYRPVRQEERRNARLRLGLPTGAPLIGSLGRFDFIKGYDVMLTAFGRLLRTWDQTDRPMLVLAGEGPEQERLEAMVRAHALGDAVRFSGWIEDARDLLSALDLFSLSSRSEGTSVSLLEAMSAGLCPVVTRVGGNASVLGPDLRHRLVPPEDPDALARAWEAALRDRDAARADGGKARARVMLRYGLAGMVRRYAEIYQGRVETS